MATYVNDLRLKEIATGDEAGTWGTSTNTNLELIAEAFSFGTEAITTDADTHTTTIADGATDPGRSFYLKYTGTLDSACTITIGPNTVSKFWLIENATSGSQNIIISQGSGANVTIPAGEVKAVYSDGAGSGAAVVDAFAGLKVSDAAQTNITSLGTLTTLTVDDITINGSTISDAGDLTIDSGGDIILDADGGEIVLKDGGTSFGQLKGATSDFIIQSLVQDKDIIFKGDDGGGVVTALTLDMSAAGAATFNGAVTANAGVSIDNITIDGTEIDLSSGSLTIDVASDLILDVGNDTIELRDSGTKFGEFISSSTDFVIKSSVSDKDLIFKGNDGGSAITALTLDMSAAGAATFNNQVTIGSGSNLVNAGNMTIDVGGDLTLDADGGDIIFSDGGSEKARFNAGKLGINTSDPDGQGYSFAEDLVILGGNSADDGVGITLRGNGKRYGIIAFGDNGDPNSGEIFYDHTDNAMSFRTNDQIAASIDSSGNLTVGTGISYNASADDTLIIGATNRTSVNNGTYFNYQLKVSGAATGQDLTLQAARNIDGSSDDVESIFQYDASSDAQIFFTNATERMRLDNSGNLGIGTNSPSFKLDVAGNARASYFALRSNESAPSETSFIYRPATGVLAFGTASTERIRIDSSGNVAIGHTSAEAKLDVDADSNQVAFMSRDQGSATYPAFGFSGQIDSNGNRGTGIFLPTDGALGFAAHSAERMRVNPTGVGIGTTSPAVKLDVVGDTRIKASSDSATALTLKRNSSSGRSQMAFTDESDNQIFRIGMTGAGSENFSFFDGSDTILELNRSSNLATFGGVINGVGGNASAPSYIFESNTDTGFFHPATDAIGFSTAGSERMRIHSGGSVSIGSTTSSGKLFVNGNLRVDGAYKLDGNNNVISQSGTTISIGDVSENDFTIDFTGYGATSKIQLNDGFIPISTNGSERVRIDGSGHLYVGKTASNSANPGIELKSGGLFTATRGDSPAGIFNRTTSNGQIVQFRKDNTTVGSVSVDASATTYNTSSDLRLKDITGSARGLEVVNELNPVSYNWKADGKSDEGLIAQEVQELVPNAVSETEEGYYQMDYSKLVTHLIKAVQEQQEQIEKLQKNSHTPKNLEDMSGYKNIRETIDNLVDEVKLLKGGK